MAVKELTIANFNTHLMFRTDGPNVEQGFEAGFRALETLDPRQEVDVLNMPETAQNIPGAEPVSQRHWEMMRSGMRALGYVAGKAARSPRNDGLITSMWMRDVEGRVDTVQVGDSIVLPRFHAPGVLQVIGLHNPSESEQARVKIAEGLVAYKDRVIAEAHEQARPPEGIVVVADTNATTRKESALTQAFYVADKVVSRIPQLAEMEHFKGSKAKQALSIGVRAFAMTRGTTLQTFLDGGFVEATDKKTQGTVHNIFAMEVDRILAAGAVTLENHRVIEAVDENGERLSDHDKVVVTARV